MSDTIFALSSGPLPSGVAVVRVSGPSVRFVCELILGILPPPRLATLRSVLNPADGQVVDRALVLFFPGPRSFTGEDVLELHLHGGRAVVAKVLDLLSAVPGSRPAQAGEFTRRAFLNDRLDLTEAEGLADLIEAQTEAQRRQSIAQAGGALSRQVSQWRHVLLDISASLSAALDFSDEGDVDIAVADEAVARCARLAADFRQAIEDGRRGEIIRDGLTVVLAGPPNAGKSALLNALARRDVAIVSPYAGTTRDLIEVTLDLDGVAIVFVDTAGIRETSDPVEVIGIGKTVSRARNADLVLWLSEDGSPGKGVFAESIRVRTKSDLRQGRDESLEISVVTSDGLDSLLDFLRRKIETLAPDEPALVTHARQRSELLRAVQALDRASVPGPLELLSEDVRLAIAALDTLVGRIGVEEVLGTIFSRFCIGK